MVPADSLHLTNAFVTTRSSTNSLERPDANSPLHAAASFAISDEATPWPSEPADALTIGTAPEPASDVHATPSPWSAAGVSLGAKMAFNALHHAAVYSMQQLDRLNAGIIMVRNQLSDANDADKAVSGCDAGLYAQALSLVTDAIGDVYSELATAAKEAE